ncbi:MAG: PAS domain S-box protein [Anaerolineales bacterium]|nr:PAS domain S-box protein [Anaerolineales bacterium]
MKKNSDKKKVNTRLDHKTPKQKKEGVSPPAKTQRKQTRPADIGQDTKQANVDLQAELNENILVKKLLIVGYVNPIDDPLYTAYVSPQIKSMLGYSPEEWLANPNLWSEVIHPLDRERVFAEMENLKITGGDLNLEYRILARDGNTVWVHDHLVLVRNADNTPQFWQGMMIDITQRKQAEKSLMESEEKFRSIVEQTYEGIAFSNEQGEIIEWNHAIEEITGIGQTEALGMPIWEIQRLLTPEEESFKLEPLKSMVLQSLQKGETLTSKPNGNLEIKIKTRDGKFKFISQTIFPVKSKKGYRLAALVRDLTDKKVAEEELHKSNERYQSIAEDMPVLISRFKHDGTLTYVNRFYCEYYKSSPDELLKKNLFEMIPDDEQEFVRKKYLSLNMDQPYVTYEFEAFDTNGRPRWQRWTDRALFDQNGEIIEFQSIGEDITERKQAEQLLIESEARFRSLIANAGDMILVVDTEGVITFASPSFEKSLGYLPQEMLGESFIKWIHPDNFSEVKTALENKGERPGLASVNIKVPGRHKDGSWRYLDVLVTNLLDEPSIMGIVLNIRDVTENEKIEKTLRESEARFSSAFENATIGMALVSTGGFIYQSNRALCDFLGYTEDELVNITFQEITHPEDLEADVQNVQRMLNGEIETYKMEKRYLHKLGYIVWGALSVSLVKSEQGEPLYFISQIKDITERKDTEAAINRQLSELETLYESGLMINSLSDPKEIAQKVIGILERRMAWHHIAIRQYNSDTNTVELIAFHNAALNAEQNAATIKRVNEIIHLPGDGLSGWVIMNGQSIRVPQVKKDKRYKEVYPGIQSGLYAPLKIGERVIGSISVESEEENGFTQQDERLLVTLAAQAAVSIENATLYLTAQKEISERKQAEDALQKQTEELVLLNNQLESRVKERTAEIEFTRQRLELATKAAGLGIWEWNINSGAMILDNQMYTILGLTSNVFDNTMKGFIDFVHAEDLEYIEKLLQEIIEGRTYFELAYRIVRKDGSVRFIHSHGLGIVDRTGRVERMIGTAEDVTAQKQAEQAVLESEAYARLLFDASPDPISVAEADGIMVDVNKFFEQQHNVKRDEIRGKHISELNIFPAEDIKKAGDYINEILQGKKLPPIELDFYTADKGLHTLEMHSYPIQVYGRPLVLSTSRDITEHKISSDMLRRANNEMERALRIKDEFLASMSHELRTPLNAILGISESLEEQIIGPLNEKQLKYLRTVSESGHHLLELINDILDLSKIEAGRIELNIAQMPAEHLVQSSLRIIKEMAQKKELQLKVDIDPNVKTMQGDERRLKQVLVNLLSNAVKFTPQGGEVGLELKGYPEDSEATITVWDTGIGIKQEDINRLFKPFVQLDSSLSREYAGTGLGLALVSQMIRLHGGSVSLTSEIGKGSRFTVTIPWEPGGQTASVTYSSSAIPAMPQAGKKREGKVMVFEDTDSISQLLNDYITYLGYKPVIARNGLEGLIIAKHERPDIIFMDIMMPGMDGLEATRQLRKDEALKNVPIIALTALAMPGDREQCIAAGMNDYISKPIRMNEISEMVTKYMVNK